jgi:BirA family biotin operon repressor/biotin-[acetyl-CoA-carboxylase] ligase
MFSQSRFEAARQIVQLCCPGLPSEWTIGVCHPFKTLASTNQTAWELLNQGAAAGTIVLAAEQTAGRGQRGRSWQSPLGGLYLSVILAPNLAAERNAELTLCTAWGIATALRSVPGKLSGVPAGIPIEIKWLNDLVLQGRKLGGILIETRSQQGQISQAVIGVGINWTNPVPAMGINLRSFLEAQSVPLIESLEMLTAITLHGLFSGYQHWQQFGIESLLPEYLALMAFRDRPIPVEEQIGKIIGITAAAELRVQVAEGAELGEVLVKPGTFSFGYDAAVD